MSDFARQNDSQASDLRDGCYVIVCSRETSQTGERKNNVGTLRVTRKKPGAEPSISGDLYSLAKAKNSSDSEEEPVTTHDKRIQFSEPFKVTFDFDKDQTIPAFPVENYEFYLDVLNVAKDASGEWSLEIQVHKFEPSVSRLIKGSNFRLQLAAHSKIPGRYDGTLFVGLQRKGQFSMQWISPILRRAAVQIIRVQQPGEKAIKLPGETNESRDRTTVISKWKKVFGEIGYDLDIEVPHYQLGESKAVTDEGWTSFGLAFVLDEFIKEFTERKRSHDWVYYLFCVSRLERAQFLGVMFDSEASDIDGIPRESAAVAALQELNLEKDKPKTPCQEAYGGDLYFRTALHEIGHALNLAHSSWDKGLMNTTDLLLKEEPRKPESNEPVVFKFDPEWKFNCEDVLWLQHAPDIAVRPSKVPRTAVNWRHLSSQPVKVVALREEPSISLELKPLQARFPLGAPVRLEYSLINKGPEVDGPSDVSLSSGFISGRVTGPDRKTRFFRSSFRCCDSVKPAGRLAAMKCGSNVQGSMTLLRGTDGPLFPLPGEYRIQLEARWDANGTTRRVITEGNVSIAEAVDSSQRDAAETIFNQRSMMLLVVQGLVNEASIETLALALNSEVLAPHYFVTALKAYQKRKLLVNRSDSGRPFAGLIKLLTSADADSTSGNRTAAELSVQIPDMVRTTREDQQLKPFFEELSRHSAPIRLEKSLLKQFVTELNIRPSQEIVSAISWDEGQKPPTSS
jgi:hypothetical protein